MIVLERLGRIKQHFFLMSMTELNRSTIELTTSDAKHTSRPLWYECGNKSLSQVRGLNAYVSNTNWAEELCEKMP
jgi:hypothetical protein